MFRGVTQLSLDAKGRLAIPARYRNELMSTCSGHLIVTVDPSKCLLIYPQPAWEPIEQKLNNLSSFDTVTRNLQRLLVGNACDVDMDAAGRILVSPPCVSLPVYPRMWCWLDRARNLSCGMKRSGIYKLKLQCHSRRAVCLLNWKDFRCN